MTEGKKVLAVVVTYNRLELLKECISAIETQDYKSDILVVDNHSNDGTDKWLEEYTKSKDDIFYVALPQNIGGAGGFNYGIKWSVTHGYDYAWIMDDDCIVKKDSLLELMKADKLLGGPGKYGFLSSVVLWKNGKVCIMNKPKVEKKFYKHIELLKNGIVKINQATFVSVLLPAKTIRKFGLPIKEYFIWGDDVEYTRRIALRGRKNSYLIGKSEVIHKMSQNIGSDIATDDISRLDRYRMAYRNENFTYRKQGLTGIIEYMARCIKGLIFILLFARDYKMKRIRTLLNGIIEGCLFNPKIEKVKGQQSIRA